MRVLSFSYGIVLRQIPFDFTDGKWNMVQLSSVQFSSSDYFILNVVIPNSWQEQC